MRATNGATPRRGFGRANVPRTATGRGPSSTPVQGPFRHQPGAVVRAMKVVGSRGSRVCASTNVARMAEPPSPTQTPSAQLETWFPRYVAVPECRIEAGGQPDHRRYDAERGRGAAAHKRISAGRCLSQSGTRRRIVDGEARDTPPVIPSRLGGSHAQRRATEGNRFARPTQVRWFNRRSSPTGGPHWGWPRCHRPRPRPQWVRTSCLQKVRSWWYCPMRRTG